MKSLEGDFSRQPLSALESPVLGRQVFWDLRSEGGDHLCVPVSQARGCQGCLSLLSRPLPPESVDRLREETLREGFVWEVKFEK